MGEVWLAIETRLGRNVALKLLPAELTQDAGRVARFEQEARAASALSHPNVCTILALDDTSDGQRYIAMEYVEGQTLRKRLESGRLPIREALDIAIQIASALAAAHGIGVIHRDIKPENVMLRPDGFVKVLDFGLAKLVAANAGTAAEATTTAFRTEAGHVVGTMAYMSPEQARGLEVDARTDIWALGVVLYEMLAGRSPFAAPTSSDTLAAVLQNEPLPLARVDPDMPAEAQRIATKTLRKDRSQRYQTVQDLLLDLHALRQTLQGTRVQVTIDAATGGSEHRVQPSPRKRLLRLIAGATLIIAAGVFAAWWRVAERRQDVGPTGGSIARPLSRLTFGTGLQTDPTWSPDGRSVAYASDAAGNFDIWVQSLAGGSPAQVTPSSAQDTEPSWSPDGRSIVFRSEREGGGLYLVPTLGGSERQLASFGTHPEWTADGSEVLFRSAGSNAGTGPYVSLYVVAADGGTPPSEILAGISSRWKLGLDRESPGWTYLRIRPASKLGRGVLHSFQRWAAGRQVGTRSRIAAALGGRRDGKRARDARGAIRVEPYRDGALR